VSVSRSSAPGAPREAARQRTAARKPGVRPDPAVRIAIVGAGRVGTALALALSRAGWPVTAIASRRLARARALARRCGAVVATTNPFFAAAACDALVLAVPDRVLPGLARFLATGVPGSVPGDDTRERGASRPAGPAIARRSARIPGAPPSGERPGIPFVVLHTSGASGADVLAPLRSRGWAVGSFHPLLSFPKSASASPSLEGAAIAVDGDPAARRLARALAGSLGARTLAIPASERVRYHLAACFASNYVVTLVWEAARLLEETGLPRGRVLAALLPLLRSTLASLETAGLPDAMTGPVARGDDVTVARHAALLRQAEPDRRALHHLLVTRTAQLAGKAGTLSAADVRRIARALRAKPR
jgi:predicted short-subunit dehydrogenase-like oxidoreductase (DUF2520 family)